MLWALVLAGGEGKRLRSLTMTATGTAVPKQFCSLTGGRTLLEDAIERAKGVVPTRQVCCIVAQQHRDWWQDALADMSLQNVIVQPRGRGTGIGILYSLLHIAQRDPEAQLLLLPADHYVRHESVLRDVLRTAVHCVAQDPAAPILLGMRPDRADTELGYIVPGQPDESGSRAVQCFVEKPHSALAGDIVRAGGLWNGFIVAASVAALLNMFMPRYASVALEMQFIVGRLLSGELSAGWLAIVDLYQRLPEIDFSRDLLEGQEQCLRVIEVPACGWSDLGTPGRLTETLQCLEVPAYDDRLPERTGRVNLQRVVLNRAHAAGALGQPGA